ncbi:MAG TPA: phenylalanine--tRNA ligase subunit alpha, partial [Thermoanaerobaculia bacterium]|nr:phenylalanine--tRNA ligase subunit alpha [Thermoanaerobaculia bacterium]
MLDDISKAAAEFDEALKTARDPKSLDELRVRFFGRKGGLVPALFTKLKDVPKEQKKATGDALNKLRDRLESELKEKSERAAAEESRRKEAREQIDVTLPGRRPSLGSLHPITLVRQEMESIFREMGYSIDPGPEIETD